jgi:hypothetical protein
MKKITKKRKKLDGSVDGSGGDGLGRATDWEATDPAATDQGGRQIRRRQIVGFIKATDVAATDGAATEVAATLDHCTNFFAASEIFEKLSKVSNHPLAVNSTHLVTLVQK